MSDNAIAFTRPAILDSRSIEVVVGDNFRICSRSNRGSHRDVEHRVRSRDTEPAETGIQGIHLHHVHDGRIGFQDNFKRIVVGLRSIDVKIDIAPRIGREPLGILLDLHALVHRVQVEPTRGFDTGILAVGTRFTFVIDAIYLGDRKRARTRHKQEQCRILNDTHEMQSHSGLQQ